MLESYTLQVLSPNLLTDAMRRISSFVAPAGTLLVITRSRNINEPKGNMPWSLTRDELTFFETLGLKEACFEDYMDNEAPPVHRFRVTYRRYK